MCNCVLCIVYNSILDELQILTVLPHIILKFPNVPRNMAYTSRYIQYLCMDKFICNLKHSTLLHCYKILVHPKHKENYKSLTCHLKPSVNTSTPSILSLTSIYIKLHYLALQWQFISTGYCTCLLTVRIFSEHVVHISQPALLACLLYCGLHLDSVLKDRSKERYIRQRPSHTRIR